MVDSGKHTPGPWYAISEGPVAKLFNSTVIVSEQIDDAIICSIGRDVPGDEANVSLIAAAPDLLNELKNIREHMVGLAAYLDNCNTQVIIENLETTIRVLRDKTDRADAAIRKAVGDGR